MRYLTKTLVVLLVLTAILTSVARWMTPIWIEHNQDQLISVLNQQSGYLFSAEKMTSRWYRTGPVVKFTKLKLTDKQSGTEILQVDQMEMRLSLIDLVRYQNFVPTSVVVDGMRLTLVRESDGDISIYGVEKTEPTSGDDAADISNLLLQPESLSLKNTRISFVDLYKTSRITLFDPAEVTLINRGNNHKLTAHLGIDLKTRGEMTLAAEFVSSGNTLAQWSGDVYLITSELDLEWLIGDKIPGHYAISKGNSSFEVWSNWSQGRLSWLHGRISAKSVVISSPDHEAPDLNLDWASGHFHWREEKKGWRLDLSNAQIASNGVTWPTSCSVTCSRWALIRWWGRVPT